MISMINAATTPAIIPAVEPIFMDAVEIREDELRQQRIAELGAVIIRSVKNS